MGKTTFTLERIMTISTTIWFVVGGLMIVLGYFGVKIYLSDTLKLFSNSLAGLAIATSLTYRGFYYLRKSFQKEKVLIEIADNKDIKIYFNDQLRISSPISDLEKIFTLHPIDNKKSSVQAEIIFRKDKIDLYDALNDKNKKAFDTFIIYLEKNYKFTHKKAPFSLRYSKHYVEYVNPLYNE